MLLLAALGEAGARPGDRIEHAALIPPELVPELARLGVRVVTQPGFLADRGDDFLRDVPPADHPDLYRCATLLRGGVPVALSSDAPFGPLDPWAVIAAAAGRRTASGQVAGPGERITFTRALDAYLAPPGDPGGPPRRVGPGPAGQPGRPARPAGPGRPLPRPGQGRAGTRDDRDREGVTMRLGFIGTGRMGHPMARKLLEAGHEVRAVARSHDKRATLAGDGAQPVARVAEAGAGADAVLVCVFTDEQVREVCLASASAPWTPSITAATPS